MKILAKQNRDLVLINKQNTQNENDAEKILLQVPEQYEDFNKKIVFNTKDGNIWDIIVNNEYLIPKAITKYEQVEFYIWLTKDDVDFRSRTYPLKFYPNIDASGEITPEEISGVNTVVNLLEEEITKVENMNITATKVGTTTTIDITNKQGQTSSVEIEDGTDGTNGTNGFSPIITETQTENGYDLTITDVNGTNTISLLNGQQGIQGEAGHTPEFGVDYWTPEQQQEIISTATTNTINNYSSTITQIQSNASNALNTANLANTTANTAKSIAEGANQALSYANYQAMVTAFNSLDDDVYRVGQNVMIVTLNVPDLWVSSVESTSASYTYTNDEAITTALSTNGYIQIGYYKLSALETQKVDLTDYYTKTGTENKIEDYLYQIMPTDSTSGAIATINDATTMFNAIDVSGTINPVQDLHGQENPYPAGGGVNLFNPLLVGDYIRYVINDDETITVTGTDGRAWTNVPVIPLSAGTYTIKVYGHKRSQIRTSEDDYMSDINLQSLAYTFTLSADGGIKLKLGLGDTYPITVYVQIESGSSATDWTPYSNVCPITGWTGLNLNRTGINIWDEQWEVGSIDNNTGRETAHSGKIRSKNYIRVVPNISIYVCCNYSGISTWNFFFYDINKNYVERLTGVANAVITVPENCFYMKFRENANTYGTTYNNNISINYPSTDTDYHSGTDNTSVTVDWTSEAGEVYGGTLNVITGELIVDRVGFDGGDINWVKVDDYNYGNFCSPNLNPLPKYLTTVPTVLSSIYRSAATSSGTSGDAYAWIRSVNTGMRRIYIKDTSKANMTAEEFKTSLIGVDFVYVLDAPIIYQLTPQQISFLQGTNNLWVNTGDISVTYKADIQKYIDKKTN